MSLLVTPATAARGDDLSTPRSPLPGTRHGQCRPDTSYRGWGLRFSCTCRAALDTKMTKAPESSALPPLFCGGMRYDIIRRAGLSEGGTWMNPSVGQPCFVVKRMLAPRENKLEIGRDIGHTLSEFVAGKETLAEVGRTTVRAPTQRGSQFGGRKGGGGGGGETWYTSPPRTTKRLT